MKIYHLYYFAVILHQFNKGFIDQFPLSSYPYVEMYNSVVILYQPLFPLSIEP